MASALAEPAVDIYSAILERDVDALQRLIQANPTMVRDTDEHGRTPLHQAAIAPSRH